MLLLPTSAFATNLQPCQINSWSPSYPNQVSPGQTIQVTSTINVSCGQWRTYYTARVDLVNGATDQYYSTCEFQIGWQPDVNATITNSATAPQTAGQWKLLYNLYIFEEGSQDGNPFHESLNINVGNPSTPAQQNVTTTATTSAMSQQQIAANSTSAPAQLPAAPVTTDSPAGVAPGDSYLALALGIVAILGVVGLVAARKRLE